MRTKNRKETGIFKSNRYILSSVCGEVMKDVVFNKKARFLYHLKEKFEAGLQLRGSEVKSLRAGRCHLKDAYVSFRGGEIFLQKAHISPYPPATVNNHEPERLRKLLLNDKEIMHIQGLIQQKKMTCIPLRVYFKKGKAKVEIAMAVGKARGDKRETLKKRSAQRQMEIALKRSQKR